MASGTSWASAGWITPTRGKNVATAVKRRAFRRLTVMFIVRSCGSGALPRIRQSGRTLAVTKVPEGNAKERTKFAGIWGSETFEARKSLGDHCGQRRSPRFERCLPGRTLKPPPPHPGSLLVGGQIDVRVGSKTASPAGSRDLQTVSAAPSI